MFYELINRFQVPLFLRITGTFLATQVLDAFFFELVVNPLHPFWFDHLRHVFLIRAISSLWIGILTTIYLQLCRKSEMEKKGQRSPFDLVIAFFGAYSKAQRLAAKLQEWEDRYRLVLDATHDLILIIDETGTILDKNRAANMFLGDLGSSSPLLYSQCFPEPPWETVWSQLYRLVGIQHWIPQRSNIQYDIEINPGTPSRKVLETNFIPFIIQKRPTILMVARDVTTRRKLEEDLKNQERQLLHAERMEAIGTLAGGIAHDFNNLLQAISGSLEQLDQEISTPSERTHRLIINIREASQRAAKLVNQLLGFARHGKYEEEQILLHELIEDVSNLFAPVLEKNYVFRKIIHPSPIIVMGDYTQLQQVILNLLFNARDATKDVLEPKITLRGEFAQETMKGWEKHPPGAQPEDYSVIRVRDNGCGIPPHILPRIFEPFFTTKGSTGTGMGLAMAYGIIENHHGWIHVESPVENQSGTEVYVFLPLASTSEKRKPKTVTELPSKK